jgi:hypothetical protein
LTVLRDGRVLVAGGTHWYPNTQIAAAELFVPNVSVVEAIKNLLTLTKSMTLAHGIENSLDAKLQSAISALTAANGMNREDAVNKLSAFINETEAQSGKHITTAEADQLVAAAQAIIARI